MKNRGRMRRGVLLSALLLALPLHASTQVPNLREPPSVFRSGHVVTYDGPINDAGLQGLKEALQGRDIQELHINSPGGDVEAGIKIGNVILDEGLNVVVTKRCLSSCANYVFTAGRQKHILPGAMVAWHGSALQANFRDRYAQIKEKIANSGAASLSEAEKRSFEHNGKLQSMQRKFFARVGVNEYVTRLGQEPIDHKISWTISVPDMEKLGIVGVKAPVWYGWPSYCSEWLLAHTPSVKCLKVTPEMLDHANKTPTVLGEQGNGHAH